MTGKLDLAPCAYMIICFSNLLEKKTHKGSFLPKSVAQDHP